MSATVLRSHYFLWFGSSGGILPFTTLIGKEYAGASATEVGLLYTILPFTVFFAKPYVCSLADKFNIHKSILIAALICTLIGYGALVAMPFIVNKSMAWAFFCIGVLIANLTQGFVISLTDSLVMRLVTLTGVAFGTIRVFGGLGYGMLGWVAGQLNDHFKQWPYLIPGLVMFIVVILIDIVVVSIFVKTKEEKPLSQGDSVRNYGSNASIQVDPSSEVSLTQLIIKPFRQFPLLYLHCLTVTIVGFLTAFSWSFLFWFLETINGQDTALMGYVLLVQCFLGELPFFLLAEPIMKRLGNLNTLVVVLIGFMVRYFCYAFFIFPDNAYYVLFVEVLQGPTTGLFYCVMAQLSQEYALKSVEKSMQVEVVNEELKDRTYATMQGIMSGCFEGLGLGIGSAVAGVITDYLGIRHIWLVGGGIAAVMAVINGVASLCKRLRR
ncbi:Major facilitator superfamily domain-containing protein 6-A [Halotydeus destructor]|nr:Major facilitator superfamily domain-containing protein 6-A [Halotydeus destructor]